MLDTEDDAAAAEAVKNKSTQSKTAFAIAVVTLALGKHTLRCPSHDPAVRALIPADPRDDRWGGDRLVDGLQTGQ